MDDTLTLDKLMGAIMSVPKRQEPRFYAGSRIAIDAFLEREAKGTFVYDPGLVDRPSSIAGVPVTVSAAMPRWAFAIVEAAGDVTLYDLEYGVSIKGSAMRLPIEVVLMAGIERLREQRERWQRAGNAPAISRLEEPGPDPQAPTLGDV